MPKKMGLNSKAEEARVRKEAASSDKKEKESKAKEDAAWNDEGAKSKAAKKKEEDAGRKAEAAAKKLEAKRLAEEEEKELAKILKKPANKAVGKPAAPKVTAAELAVMKERELKQREAEGAAVEKRKARMADPTEYERLVSVENTNRQETLVDARSVGEALSQIQLTDGSTPDKHPERRLKASFKAFEETELARLRSEKPGMTLTQYKDLIWKEWKKSPLNPMNQGA
eukprot:jgi/Mesen1/10157/ME000076S09658